MVIAGTAGSGKTHMLQQLDSHLAALPVVEFGEEAPSTPYVRKVSDLTAVQIEKYSKLFAEETNCKAIIVAANEGALLSANSRPTSLDSEDLFSEAVELLHLIQRGDKANKDSNLVVVDAAGFDPSANAVLEELLVKDIINEFVESDLSCDSCEHAECIRRKTWRQLQSSEVRKRVGELVSAASVNAEGFTFRLVWNFIADLLLGGECNSENGVVPTSAWFWRIFNGDSIVSKHIAELFPEYQFTIPHAESHLWYGDWYWFSNPESFQDGIEFVPTYIAPCDHDSDEKANLVFRWLKSQALFLSYENPFISGMTTTDASGLWRSLSMVGFQMCCRLLINICYMGFSRAAQNSTCGSTTQSGKGLLSLKDRFH